MKTTTDSVFVVWPGVPFLLYLFFCRHLQRKRTVGASKTEKQKTRGKTLRECEQNLTAKRKQQTTATLFALSQNNNKKKKHKKLNKNISFNKPTCVFKRTSSLNLTAKCSWTLPCGVHGVNTVSLLLTLLFPPTSRLKDVLKKKKKRVEDSNCKFECKAVQDVSFILLLFSTWRGWSSPSRSRAPWTSHWLLLNGRHWRHYSDVTRLLFTVTHATVRPPKTKQCTVNTARKASNIPFKKWVLIKCWHWDLGFFLLWNTVNKL